MANQNLLQRVLDDLDHTPEDVKDALDAHLVFCQATAAQRKDTVSVESLVLLQTAISGVMAEKTKDLADETVNCVNAHKQYLWRIGVRVAVRFDSTITGMRAAVSALHYLLEQLAGNPPTHECSRRFTVASMIDQAILLNPPVVKVERPRRQKENRPRR
jgi:hypothetical protein